MAEGYGKEERTWVGRLAERSYRESKDQMISRARKCIMDKLSVHKARTADIMTSVATSLRRASEELIDQNQIAELEASAANKIDDLSRFLRTTQMDELAEQAERIVRRRPAVLFGSTFVLGFLVARYLTNANRGSSEKIKGSYASM